MSNWYRIFSAMDTEPEPEKLLEHLFSSGLQPQSRFRGDDQGWFALEMSWDEKLSPVILERFLATEEGIRRELNTWAGWLETCDYSPNHAMLMERVIQSKQIYTLRRPVDHADEARLDHLCEVLTHFVAEATDGIIQIDSQGFFDPAGELLLQEY